MTTCRSIGAPVNHWYRPKTIWRHQRGRGLRSPSGQEERMTGRRKERKRENRISLNIDILGLPMQLWKRGTDGSALILAVRISLGWEEDKMMGGGVQMMWQQIRQDLFQEWFVDREEKGERVINPLWLIWELVVPDFSQVLLKTMVFAKRERVKMGPALVSQCWVVINLSLSRSLEAYRCCDLRSGF
jgi:hypothetical protein